MGWHNIYIYIYIYIVIDTVRWVSMEVLAGRCVVCVVSSGCQVRWDIYIYIYIYIYILTSSIYVVRYKCKLDL